LVAVACGKAETKGEPTTGGTGATEPECVTGDEGCPCYPNETCNADLTCASHLCVQAAQTAADDGILTFVVGMGEVDPSALDSIAVAGGTGAAFIVSLGDPEVTEQAVVEALSIVADSATVPARPSRKIPAASLSSNTAAPRARRSTDQPAC